MNTYAVMQLWLNVLVISLLDAGQWSVSHAGCFTPGERTAVPTGLEAGWALEQVCTR